MNKIELVRLSDEVWDRTRRRLADLSDDEYFWEPAPGCWTVRQRRDGSWVADSALPRPEPEPFTTIAWRLWHLIDMYGEDRAPKWLNVPPQGLAIGIDAADDPPASAADALALLLRAHDRWDRHLHLVSDESLLEAVGTVAGPEYRDASRAAYVLHMLDEFIHHGAEIATLRDLWRWQRPLTDDARTELAMRGDARLVDHSDAVEHAESDATTGRLVATAAEYARWELVVELLERGSPMATTGRTPLHLAAGAGELAVVERLLALGADPSRRDDVFHATPRQWAEFLGKQSVVDYFDSLGS